MRLFSWGQTGFILGIFACQAYGAVAQRLAPDTIRSAPDIVRLAPTRGRVVRAVVIPAVLIGYGVSTINGHGFYSSYQARDDIQRAFPHFHSSVDDYLPYAPYLALGIGLLPGHALRDDALNLALLVAKSEVLALGLTNGLKVLTNIDGPGGKPQRFPSSHATQAFLAATIVNIELRGQSHWYGIGAYSVASSVAVLRMLNNKHWESDVVAGAGFGILSAHLAYLSQRYRWGRRPARTDGLSLAPMYFGPAGAPGLCLVWRPQ